MKITLRKNVFRVSFGRGVYFLCGASNPLLEEVKTLAQKETTRKISLLIPSFLFPNDRCPAKILRPIEDLLETNHICLLSLVSYPGKNQKFWSNIHSEYVMEFDGHLFWRIICKKTGKVHVVIGGNLLIPSLDEPTPHFVRFTDNLIPLRRILGESNAKKGHLIFI